MMQILKKNILSIVCGVIVIGAVAAYFLFVRGYFWGDNGLQKLADDRKGQYERLNGLLTKGRALPVVDLQKTDATPLAIFPNAEVIKAGKQLTQQLTGQSKAIMDIAVRMNRHDPLIPGSFPKPDDNAKFSFRDAYETVITKGIPDMLNAAAPPNDEQVAAAENKLWEEKYAKDIYYVDGREANREIVDQKYNAEIMGLREKMEKQTAQTHRLYLEPTAITTNMALYRAEQLPDTAQVWYAQSALWIQQDVARSIADLNERVLSKKDADKRNILNAPVKHIVNIDVPQGQEQYLKKPPAQGAAEESSAAPTGPDYSFTPTGRVCNAKYDVVKFTLVVKMEAAYVPTLIQELSRGKFLTAHKVELASVDSEVAREDGYFYGPAPVVQATITGEGLLLHDWTAKLVPEVVKKELTTYQSSGGETPVAAGQ